VGKHNHSGGNGGNAHDRAVARAAKAKPDQPTPPQPNKMPPFEANTVSVEPGDEWREPLNRADSMGLLGMLLGVLFVLVVPTVWYKVPAFALLCFGTAYFIWLSHWTYRLAKGVRAIVITIIVVALSFGVVPQFIEQWRVEHMRSELAFTAKAPGVAYPDGDHYGMKWAKADAEIRFTVTSQAKFPIQNLNLSIWTTAKDYGIAGMAQSDTEPEGCVIRRPREQLILPALILRGADGSSADISPLVNDTMSKAWPLRDHYDLLCQRILAGESIPLVLGTLTNNIKGDMSAQPSQFHIKGDYETTAAEGSKRVSVDSFVPVSTLAPWK